MYQEVGEKIKVLAAFVGGQIRPKVFEWSGRKYKISNVALAYQERSGRSMNYFFGVECESGGVFKLSYNDENLTWTLEEHWVE